MNSKLDNCIHCESENVKKLISAPFFKVTDGTVNFGAHGYTGKHQDLVKKLHGNKNYQDGYRNEVRGQEKLGLNTFREEQKMAESQKIFEKMREEGAKMSKEEKDQLKAEHGIKKGMKNTRMVF
jgi:hypothetical protein